MHIHLFNLLSSFPSENPHPPPSPLHVFASSSFSYSLLRPFPFHSLHLHHSLYVQGTVTTRDRGQAPLQEELRDSHHERGESCESGLHIAASRGASSRGEWPHPDSGERAIGKLMPPPKYIPPSPRKKGTREEQGAITVH